MGDLRTVVRGGLRTVVREGRHGLRPWGIYGLSSVGEDTDFVREKIYFVGT